MKKSKKRNSTTKRPPEFKLKKKYRGYGIVDFKRSDYRRCGEGISGAFYHKKGTQMGIKVYFDRHDSLADALNSEGFWEVQREAHNTRTIRARLKKYVPRWSKIVFVRFKNGEVSPGLMMEYIPGKLFSHNRPNYEYDEDWLQLEDQLTDKLAEHGVTHDDLHGSNIILGKDSQWYIVDWNCAELNAPPDPLASLGLT